MPPEGFTPIAGPYSEHIGGAWTHPKTGAVYFLTTWRENSRGTYWLQCWEDVPPYGDPHVVWQVSADPWGHGTQTWLPDGSLYVAAPGNVDGSGKVKPSVHIERNVFPPIPLGVPPGPAASGGYVVAPQGSVRLFMDTNGFDGKQLINLAAAGIPPCSAVNIRLAVDGAAGRLFRCGPPTEDPNLQAAALLTVTALGAPQRAYESGVVSVFPSRTLLVTTENGPIAAGFVDVTGWWV